MLVLFRMLSFCLFISFLHFACSGSKQITCNPNRMATFCNPPNGIKINEKLFCDQTEISNIGWLEYMVWTKRVFGKNSLEYKSTLPNKSIWKDKDLEHYSIKDWNLTNFRFAEFPIVGITQEQAMNYSIWRTDRVFEMFLNVNLIIKSPKETTKENYFTVEKYFSGKLNIEPDTAYLYYPEFRLPNLYERTLILHYSDSVDNAYQLTNDCKKCWLDYYKTSKDSNSKRIIKLEEPVRQELKVPCIAPNGLHHIRGNVREWVIEPRIAVGECRINLAEKETIKNQDIFFTNQVNAWTGFRNVCEWKKFEKKN